jgi:hypothetical protein
MELNLNMIAILVAVVFNFFIGLSGTLRFLARYGERKWVMMRTAPVLLLPGSFLCEPQAHPYTPARH